MTEPAQLRAADFREELATAVHRLDAHLDRDVAERYQGQPLAQDWARVAKVVEEAGEAIAELIGMTGQNPRKGITSDEDKLLGELADVALTGIYAMQHFTKDSTRTLDLLLAKAKYHCGRVGIPLADPACRHCGAEVYEGKFCESGRWEPDYSPLDDPVTWRHRGSGYAACGDMKTWAEAVPDGN